MITTPKLIAAIKKSHGDCSDYRVSKLLGVSTGAVILWTQKKSGMGDKNARKAAQLLGLDEDYVVACIHAEKLQGTESYPVWQSICEKLEEGSRAA